MHSDRKALPTLSHFVFPSHTLSTMPLSHRLVFILCQRFVIFKWFHLENSRGKKKTRRDSAFTEIIKTNIYSVSKQDFASQMLPCVCIFF